MNKKEIIDSLYSILKSLAFCVGWIITAYIGLWAMALYGVTIGIIAGSDKGGNK